MSTKLLLPTLAALFLFTQAPGSPVNYEGSDYFLSYPALSPDGKTIVFSYEGDLWKADAAGGQAMRLTAMQGYESHARISPDGR